MKYHYSSSSWQHVNRIFEKNFKRVGDKIHHTWKSNNWKHETISRISKYRAEETIGVYSAHWAFGSQPPLNQLGRPMEDYNPLHGVRAGGFLGLADFQTSEKMWVPGSGKELASNEQVESDREHPVPSSSFCMCAYIHTDTDTQVQATFTRNICMIPNGQT